MQQRAPEVATPRAMASATGTFYLAGGLAGIALGLGGGEVPRSGGTALVLLGSSALLVSLLLLTLGRRLPRTAFHGVTQLATVLISLALVAAPDLVTALAVSGLYLFVVVDIVFFFGPRAAVVHSLLTTGCAFAALAQHHPPWGVLVALELVAAAVAVVVGRLVRLASSATRDALTGLANRRGFDEALQSAVAEADRSGAVLSLVLMDLDDFKRVNDSGGHAAGDDLLRSVGQLLRDGLVPGCTGARFGGDEFAVLATGVPAARLREVMDSGRPRTPAGYSCGLAQHVRGENASTLVRRADVALFEAKAAGRGCSRIAA